MPDVPTSSLNAGEFPKPPIAMPPEAERVFMVGDSRYMASEGEWIASQLNEGDRIRVTRNGVKRFGGRLSPNSQPQEPYVALVVGSWFYDGLILNVEEVRHASLIPHGVRPEFDAIEPLDRAVQS